MQRCSSLAAGQDWKVLWHKSGGPDCTCGNPVCIWVHTGFFLNFARVPGLGTESLDRFTDRAGAELCGSSESLGDSGCSSKVENSANLEPDCATDGAVWAQSLFTFP